MKLTFIGTKGNIDATSDHHKRHSILLIDHKGERVMIDCGA